MLHLIWSGWLRWNCPRSEEHTSELQSRLHLVCRLLLEKKNPLELQLAVHRHPRLEALLRRIWIDAEEHVEQAERRHDRQHQRHHLADFFFNDAATTEIYTLSLHDALPIS